MHCFLQLFTSGCSPQDIGQEWMRFKKLWLRGLKHLTLEKTWQTLLTNFTFEEKTRHEEKNKQETTEKKSHKEDLQDMQLFLGSDATGPGSAPAIVDGMGIQSISEAGQKMRATRLEMLSAAINTSSSDLI